MIITKTLQIKTTNKNITHYKNIGYVINSGDIIEIKPDDLPYSSKTKILVKCTICEKEQEISIYSYRRNIKNYGYYSCISCSNSKKEQTCLDKYGVDSYTKTKEYVDKTKKTKKEKYGDENYVNLEKQKETNNKKYGNDFYMNTNDFKLKSKKTMNDKYGVEFALQSENIIKKLIKTNNDKYGVDFVLQSELVKEKIKLTKSLKYDNEYYNNRGKYTETNLKKYNVKNPMQVIEIQQKLSNIMFEKYGVYYAAQLPEFYNKMTKDGLKIKKYKELYYQGSYEKDFLERYYDIGISRGPTIKYLYNNIEHTYYSDFYYKKLNLIIEIKSKKWYDEHLDKNLIKQKSCREQGYNFLFIIDKNYEIFEKLIKHDLYNKPHCWQYELRLQTLDSDKKELEKKNIDINNININDFEFFYIDNTNKEKCNEIKSFIEKYEWLGKMPNRPTHRFISTYKGILSGVIILSTPNNFSNFLGSNTKNIEKLISRGACASWTPKNLASKLLMWSLRWMVKNTEFRIFSAYSDTEAKELGIIYQACNFYYMGQNYGSDKLYFDLSNPNIGWTSGRNFRKISFYKKISKENNIEWKKEWSNNYSILWDIIPKDIQSILKTESKNRLKNCLVRNTVKKHKYVYILGKNKSETKKLRKMFLENNKIYKYVKN